MAGKRKLTRRQLIKGIAGAVTTGGIYTLGIEPNWLDTVRVRVPIKGLPAAFEGYRIGFFSDFHLGNAISPRKVREAGEVLMAAKPDLILLGGDYLHRDQEALDDLKPAFQGLAAPDGVLGVSGNHDHWVDFDRIVERLHGETPIRLIDRETVLLSQKSDRLAIVGTRDYWHSNIEAIAEQLGSIEESIPRILLQHNPDVAEELPAGSRVDLQLSGHTHGGQVVLPIAPSYIPSSYGWKFARGLVEGKSHRVFITKGIGGGAWMRPRFFARPDVSLIELTAG